MLIFSVPASIWQHRHSPIVKEARRDLKIDWARVGIVAAILLRDVVAVFAHLAGQGDLWPYVGT